ncbi:hypothetical protein O6H91_06G146100 [Diphasiastrum complanatum]|uniref:Uncharacterized protein n=1 Tax=Diphasiastrum complanatum TaxID=34168 RepID=A0ACC2DK93_DIPCM|nr:hypothetical protein O6H91_06G146100 [Diphasiastrum complanatum]
MAGFISGLVIRIHVMKPAYSDVGRSFSDSKLFGLKLRSMQFGSARATEPEKLFSVHFIIMDSWSNKRRFADGTLSNHILHNCYYSGTPRDDYRRLPKSGHCNLLKVYIRFSFDGYVLVYVHLSTHASSLETVERNFALMGALTGRVPL